MQSRPLLNPGLAVLTALAALLVCPLALTQSSTPTHSSSSGRVQKPAADAGIESGSVANGVYRNKSLGLTYKIPEGWVLRTDEMNAKEDAANEAAQNPHFSQNQGEAGHPTSAQPQTTPRDTKEARVLLAAFSRPPEARGEDVNSSIVIAAENVEVYPGLKEAAQYFGPLTEVAVAQGFSVDEEPYEVEIGTRKQVRGDFHKDVGSRVMRQSTLVWLAHGYAISITVIGGTEDEVEQLVDGVTFGSRER